MLLGVCGEEEEEEGACAVVGLFRVVVVVVVVVLTDSWGCRKVLLGVDCDEEVEVDGVVVEWDKVVGELLLLVSGVVVGAAVAVADAVVENTAGVSRANTLGLLGVWLEVAVAVVVMVVERGVEGEVCGVALRE